MALTRLLLAVGKVGQTSNSTHRFLVSLITRRNMSSSAAGRSKFLVDEPRYAFLKELGLERTNLGVYNGKWFANGDVHTILLLNKL